ncbi:amidohydrolase family protein [Sphingomonas sp.]|uniref:amidohydrolase family protein n=1 Tax=Sphingomonas sp. TaxID=28214 RepID=UPI0031DCF837
MTIPFIDAHFHLWDLQRLQYGWLTPPFDDQGPNGDVSAIAMTYLPDRFRADLVRWNLVGAVHVEAGADPGQALAETAWLQRLGDADRLPTAIVAHADLTDPDVDDLLAAQARHDRVRGIRQIVNWHPDPARTYMPVDVTLDPAWARGFARLAAHGLGFDLQCYPAQMPHIAAILTRHPDVPVRINHMGMPVPGDPDGIGTWRTGMRALAALPQVAVKISGPGFIRRDWTPELVAPIIREAIALFGTDRTMFASDVPTDTLFGSVDRHMETYAAIAADFPQHARRAMFAGNANRLYRLGLDSLLEDAA